MPDLTVLPSPSSLVSLAQYDVRTAVMTNESDKDIVAFKAVWIRLDANKRRQVRELSSCSFRTARKTPVLQPHSRLFLTPETIMWEEPVGDSFIAAMPRSVRDDAGGTISVHLDVVLFDDGEVIGHDRYRFLEELEAQKAAAGRVAKLVRAALARGDAPDTVLKPLAEGVYMKTDFKAQWRKRYAVEYFRSVPLSEQRRLEGWLRSLELMPALPRFYRNDD